MCWQGWNPDWDTIEWRDRAFASSVSGRQYTQDEVYELNRRGDENRKIGDAAND